ncbi:MAG: hypothetical protein ACHQHO_01060 [Solirubrobacterales bacterium]
MARALKIDAAAAPGRPAKARQPAGPEAVPVEGGEVEGYEVQSRTEVRRAQRRERELQQAYAEHLRRRGEIVTRNKIPVPGSKHSMFTDLFVQSRGHLIEAKAGCTRNDVRMAIGQLADYARFLPEARRLAVLLGSRPDADLLALLASSGIAAVWRSGASFKDNAGGEFT